MSHRRMLLPSLVILMMCFAVTSPAAERVLVADGASDYDIVMGNGDVPRMAVGLLRDYIEASSGVRLGVSKQASPDRKHIFVGSSPKVEQLGVSVKDLPAEGFRMKTVGDDIFLVGVDVGRSNTNRVSPTHYVETGTLSAVCEFLERFAGVRWYGCEEKNRILKNQERNNVGDLYTIVPKHERIAIPDLDESQSPAFSYRLLAYSPMKSLRYITGRRWRLGASRSISHSHAWFKILPPEKYGDHPEYYAELNGQRRVPKKDENSGWQVCTTNPDVIRIFADAALAHFKEDPGSNMFSISPNDGTHFCECKNCTALDVEYYPNDGRWNAGMPVLTDRILTFYNAVAERVAKEMPDKYLGAYLYSFYSSPPKRVKTLHPNLVFFRTMNCAWRCYGPEQAEGDAKKVNAWSMLKTGNYLYEIFYWPKQVMGMMQPHTKLAVSRMRYWKEAGVDGTLIYVYPSWETGGVTAYLLGKLLWNPDCDAEKIISEYYGDMYGPAAKTVRAYYDRIEDRWAAPMLGTEKGSAAARYYAKQGKNQQNMADMLVALEPFVEPGTRLMDQAATEATEAGANVKERLARLRDHHDLMAATVKGLVAAADIQLAAEPSAESLETFVAAYEQRIAVTNRMKSYAEYLLSTIADCEDKATSPMLADAGVYEFAKAVAGGKGKLAVRNIHPFGDFDTALPEDERKRRQAFDTRSHGDLPAEQAAVVVDDVAFEGKRSLRITVPKEGGVVTYGFQVRPKAETSYRLTFRFRSKDVGEYQQATVSPSTRVRFVVPGADRLPYSRWSTDAMRGAEGWALYSHFLKTPAKCNRLNVSVFFACPGTYWIDDVRVTEYARKEAAK